VTGTTLTVTGPDKQSVKVEPGEQELKITCAGLETTTKSFSLKKGEKKTVTVSIVNKEIVAQLENEILPLLTPAREEKASNPTASSTSPSLPLSAPVSQPRPVTAPDSRPISLADQEGVDHLKTILTSYAWKYFDSAYPGPGDPIRFHSNGKFHDVWHWNYWVVGPRTMHIQFWDAKYDPHSALVATFSDDLTTFHAAFPGHDITGKRQGPINADRASHSPTDPDRRAAEWVLSIGGRPGIESDGEERDVDQLPPGPFKLRKVQLYNNQKVNDAGLACLNGCRNLKELGLWLTKVSDTGLANVTDCKNLSVLYLSGNQVTDAGLAHFRECKGLTSLGLLGTKASDEGLAYFRNCTNLEVLELPDQSRVSDAGLLQFRDCRNLKKLNLYLAKITDAGLANLDGLVNLEYLSLAHTGQGVTDASLQRIGNLRRLKTLYLSGTRVTDAGLAHLEGLTQLELLEMDQTQIHGAGLKHLRNLVRLKSLGFRNLGLMDADLVHLRNLTALEFLGLAETRVSGPGLASLKAMNQLHELDLNNSRILSSGLDHLKNLSQLVKLGLRGTQMTDAGLHHLEGMTNLDELDLSDTKVTAAGVATLHESLPACRIITKFATSASALDPFQPKSIWVGNKKPKLVLTVTERKGASFRAKFVVGPGITRMISGTVKDGKVDWFAKDVIAIKGRVGDDNHGTIASDDLGDKIDFVWGQGSEIKGQFTLRLQK
jgi:internalin A